MTEPFDAELVERVRAIPEVADAEGWSTLQVRLRVNDDAWSNLELNALPDFDDIRIDRVLPESGA